ncbi:DUF7224 domain-containing protein [Streptomyces lonarensis]|uniref:DUF7224 domain-containing protein n=1 Tax=Streptomyces lonarensis TaxID=700599 RepID=A0A7X6I075_9ACTN|nr:hypothetical protein [Streptomyces lonarensis]NJQ07305.1 hypothetical protein [Streptomyces lonarensis]
MTGYRIELRRSPLRWWYLPLVALAAAMAVLPGAWQDSWPRASAAASAAALPLMVAGCGLVAHRAGAAARRGADAPVASRRGSTAELVSLAADATWLAAAHLTAVAVVWGAALAVGLPGAPWPEYPLFGLAGVVLAAAVGHVLGRLLPTRYTPVLATVGGYVLFLAVMADGSPLTATIGYQGVEQRLSATHLVWRLALVALAVTAVVLLTGGRSDARPSGRRPARSMRLAGPAAAAALLVGVVAMPSGPEAGFHTARTSADPACDGTVDDGEVCVWPEHAHRLPDAVDMAGRLAAAGEGVIPAGVVHREVGLAGAGAVGQGFLLDHGRGDLARTMAGGSVAATLPVCDRWGPQEWAVQDALTLWLELRALDTDRLPNRGSFSSGEDADRTDEVVRVLALPHAEQTARARAWTAELEAAPC